MPSIKQSNWILGLGILVAILLIATSIWLQVSPEQSTDAVNNTAPEIDFLISKVKVNSIGWLSQIINTLN